MGTVAYAHYNVRNDTQAGVVAQTQADAIQHGGSVAHLGSKWQRLRKYPDTRSMAPSFTNAGVIGPNEDFLSWTFPAAETAALDSVVTHSAQTFAPGLL